MPVPKRVVIVGGSLAGLFHGLYLKRHGSRVVVIEQDPGSVRSSHQAGIAFGPAVEEILRQYDDTGMQSCTPAVGTRIAYRRRQNVKEINVVRHLTSWGLLYRILRANFDGLASEAVPNPPPPRDGDGPAEYRSGQRVTSLRLDQTGAVTVGFIDPAGVEGSVTADLVIGADGVHSTVRDLVHAPATGVEYSGYVAWRGTVCESALPPEVAAYFAPRTSLNFLRDTYIVTYAIPPSTGTFTPGTRLINWVWYLNIPPSSPSLIATLTDTTGHVHANTVPSHLTNTTIFHHHLAEHLPSMPPPFATLLSSTPHPFVTKINDARTDAAVFLDGRVVLVGDSLAAFRPHFAVATEQAARHCLGLGRVWDGEGGATLEGWEREAVGYGERMWLASRLLGAFGLGRWGEFWGLLGRWVVGFVRGLVRGY
ncbi:zeaxanthin epoxidase, chloroplastic [Staphylotrichum tortipilum]|uniref:Zeaxanthin epoxidase, chloroplastic n=1 Tax=Staphylotrichum tortipilum TaxID=2831512 RepID=A0AAN6MNF3_9PEZI|nr:zeaxanthin epoxidase, chloroplastic [Staphylotrichum longicolle]